MTWNDMTWNALNRFLKWNAEISEIDEVVDACMNAGNTEAHLA